MCAPKAIPGEIIRRRRAVGTQGGILVLSQLQIVQQPFVLVLERVIRLQIRSGAAPVTFVRGMRKSTGDFVGL